MTLFNLLWKIKIYRVRNRIKQYGFIGSSLMIVTLFFLVWAFRVGYDNTEKILISNKINLYLFYLMISIYILVTNLKWLYMKKKICIRGIYESLLYLTTDKVHTLFSIYIFDKAINRVAIIILLFVCINNNFTIVGISYLLLNCIFVLISFIFLTSYEYCFAIVFGSQLNTVKRNSAITNLFLSATNIFCLLGLILFKQNQALIFILIIASTLFQIIYNVRNCKNALNVAQFRAYDYIIEERCLENAGGKFSKVSSIASKIFRNKSISFILSKEITQIFMEKIPLFYSFLYGLIMFFIVLLSSSNNEILKVIFVFCFFISCAYSFMGVSINIVARELKGNWILRVCKIEQYKFIFGKYIAHLFISCIFSALYIFIYGFINEFFLKSIIEIKYHYMFAYTLLFIAPISFCIGGIIGTYFIPKVKYNNGSIDYSYSGVEMIFMLIAIYLVALPVYLLYSFSKTFVLIILLLISIYITSLFVLLNFRIKKNLFRG